MLSKLIRLLVDTWQNFWRHDSLNSAAALAFYAAFSLAPLILVVVAIASFFFSDSDVQIALITRVRELVSEDAADLAQTILENSTVQSRGVFSLLVGGLAMLIGATTAFAQLHGVINRIWGVRKPGKEALIAFLKGRLWSFGFLLIIGLLLVASLFLSAALNTFDEFLSRRVVLNPAFWTQLDLLISYIVTTVLIATIYKFLPDRHVDWRPAIFAAFVASLLFEGSKSLIEIYVSRMSVESLFGAAGSVIVFLLWIYCAALIVLFGAELSRVAADRQSADEATSADADETSA